MQGAGKRVRASHDWFWFCFSLVEIIARVFFNQSNNAVNQNQSKPKQTRNCCWHSIKNSSNFYTEFYTDLCTLHRVPRSTLLDTWYSNTNQLCSGTGGPDNSPLNSCIHQHLQYTVQSLLIYVKMVYHSFTQGNSETRVSELELQETRGS